MFKKSIITLIVAMFVLVPFAMAIAGDAPGGKPKKGKFLYRSKVFGKCFKAGEVDSKTPSVSPADKKRVEWNQIFENNKFEVFGCVAHWEALTAEQVIDIHSYFYAYAADSPTPATCK